MIFKYWVYKWFVKPDLISKNLQNISSYIWCVGRKSIKLIFDKIPRKTKQNKYACSGRFLMYFTPIDRYRGNTCEIFKMINMITGKKHITESVNWAMCLLAIDSIAGKYHSPSLDPGNVLIKLLLNARYRVNIPCYRVNGWKIHNSIEFSTPADTWSGQYTWIVVSRSETFLLFKRPGSFKKIKIRRKYRVFKGLSIDITHPSTHCSFYSTFKYSPQKKIIYKWIVITGGAD